MPCKITKNALPIFCALATVRVVPLYQLCRIVGYLCVASPRHIAGIVSGFVKKSEFWKFFFWYEPCTNPFHHCDYDWKHNYARCSPSCDAQQLQLRSTGLTPVTDTGHFWQLFCITEKWSWISWLKTTYGHFLDTQIHTSNNRTFANTAQMMMKLCLKALHCSDYDDLIMNRTSNKTTISQLWWSFLARKINAQNLNVHTLIFTLLNCLTPNISNHLFLTIRKVNAEKENISSAYQDETFKREHFSPIFFFFKDKSKQLF